MCADKKSAVTCFTAWLPVAMSERHFSIAFVCQRREPFGVKVSSQSHEKLLKL